MSSISAPHSTPAADASRASLPVHVSVGIMAWNEEDSIRTTLESLFRQSIFEKLAARGLCCEIICIANGCTDGTVDVASRAFEQLTEQHTHPQGIKTRVVNIVEPGRSNAWNRFVHEFSAPETRFICLMDADIVFKERDTLISLADTLERNPHASVSTGRHYKDIFFKKNKTILDRVSLATSSMTGTIPGGFSGQLYCMRSDVMRNIRLPRDLVANDDGFMKAVICTQSLTRQLDVTRIARAPDAAIIYEAYVSVREVLNNQKRQMIGQTTVHVLLSYLNSLPLEARAHLAETIEQLERKDPDWFKKLNARHIQNIEHFWQLFPGILTFRFKRLAQLPGLKKLTHAPAAAVGFGVTMIACWRAFRFLRSGTAAYWPKPKRQTILHAAGLEAK